MTSFVYHAGGVTLDRTLSDTKHATKTAAKLRSLLSRL